jgi:hypothetical protein
VKILRERYLGGTPADWLIEHGSRWLSRKTILLWKRRDSVAATRPRCDGSIGDQLLALVQADLLFRPINLVADAIGKIDQTRLRNGYNSRFAEVEPRVMFADSGVMFADSF